MKIEDSGWKEEEIDCEAVFPQDMLPRVGSSIDMGFVDTLRLERAAGARGEEFLPTGNIYLRQEVRDTFNELTKGDRKYRQVLIGSPGVGKSVLLFLVALYQATVRKVPVLYVRKTKVPDEEISAFFLKQDPSKSDTKKVSVNFAREIDTQHPVADIETYLVHTYTSNSELIHKRLKTSQKALLFVDGVQQDDDDLKKFKAYNYLCTSAGHSLPSSEQRSGMELVILNAWEKQTLKLAVMGSLELLPPSPQHLAGTQAQMGSSAQEPSTGSATNNNQHLPGAQPPTTPPRQEPRSIESDESDEKFEEMYFHTGGRIREAIAFLKNPDEWVKNHRAMLGEVEVAAAKLAVTDTKSSGSKQSLDRLRTMFKATDHAGAHQIVDSQFYARELRKRLGPESYLNAYKFAVKKNLKTAAGCHFEELMHECFKEFLPAPVKEVIQAEGTAADGVKQLAKPFAYWIPSTPNFANIDAAFVDRQKKLWCIQYTVSETHKFNTATFRTKFLRPLGSVIDYSNDDVGIVFVVPKGVEFMIPEDANEFNSSTVYIDCTSVDTLQKLPFPFLNPTSG